MTIVAANWVGESTSTVGTGPLALSGAISTFCPFSVLPDGSEVYYTLQEGFNRETGIGVVSNGTLTRKVQATLVAGVYARTDIPISLSGNGQVFAVINADFMTRIYNFSLNVADSVSAAAASAKSSSDSASLANDYKTQSAQSAKNASASAQSASDSKADATASKNAAAGSATAASNSQSAALASQNAAKTSETNSKNSETNAKASETAANNFAKSSGSAATNSQNSATAAKASQDAAKVSETNSKTSETNSKNSENAAAASQTDAANSKAAAAASQSDAANSETAAANSATAAAASAELARQYQPNTALQLFTKFVNATDGNTMNDNLADGVYSATADSPGAPLAVDGKVWVTHRVTACHQTWESRVAAGAVNYGRKFFRTGVDNGSGRIIWGDWREHVFMDLNGIAKVLRGVDSTFTLGAIATNSMHAVGLQQVKNLIPADSTVAGALQRSGGTMSGGIVMGGNTITQSGKINFSSPSNARQTLLNMGVMGSPERLVIPISNTQAWCMQSGTIILNFNSSGEATLSYPMAFATLNTFVCMNGDANVTGGDYVDSLVPFITKSYETSLRNRRITGGGIVTCIIGIYRVNWVATGLINI